MSTGHTVTITPSDALVEARLGGELMAATASTGPGFPPATTSSCPFEGEASYWSADVGGERHDGIVWAYEEPILAAAAIAGHLSFYPDRTEITVDGEHLARRAADLLRVEA